MKERFAILFITVGLFVGACSKGDGDESLTSAEYYALGFPQSDSAWGLPEYKKSVEVLKGLREEDYASLPKLSSERSKEIFKKLIATGNIDRLLTERAVPGEPKFMQVYQDVILVYIGAGDNRNYYHEELTDLLIYFLEYSDGMLNRVRAKAKAAGLSDAEAQMELERYANGYKGQVVGLLDAQKDIEFTETDRGKLNTIILASLTENAKILDEPSKREIAVKVKEALAATPSDFLQVTFRGMIMLLEKSRKTDRSLR